MGDTLSIVIIRDGKTMTVEAALQESKPDTSSSDDNDSQQNQDNQGSGDSSQSSMPEDSQGGSLRDWLGQFGF